MEWAEGSWPPCCSAGSAARRWAPGWPTCSSAPPSQGAAAHHHSDAVGAQPFPRELPGRTASCATARACSWATAVEHSAIVPRFPFRSWPELHVVSDLVEPTLSADTYRPGETLTVSVPVTNTGARAGLRGRPVLRRAGLTSLGAPAQGAQGFRQGVARAWRDSSGRSCARRSCLRLLGSGSGRLERRAGVRPRDVQLPLAASAARAGWQVDAGRYEILIGRSSEDLRLAAVLPYPTTQVGDRESSCRTTSNP